MRYTTRPLDASTWAAFAELAERNNGVYGGCWCMAYHPEVSRTHPAHNRAAKQRRVHEGRAHATLVLDEAGSAQGWCQYGIPDELPDIKHKCEYDKDRRPRRTGGSPACLSTRSTAARASPGQRWKAPSARSPISAVGESRRSPRRPSAARRRAASCSAQRWSYSSRTASPAIARSANTPGS